VGRACVKTLTGISAAQVYVLQATADREIPGAKA
jgi:hypothetical protein